MTAEYITSRKNPLLLHARKMLRSRSYRREQQAFAGEGWKLLGEALTWRASITAVILSEDQTAPELPDGVRVARVPTDVLASVSQMEAPQGVIFLCAMPDRRPLEIRRGSLILDGLQDPGNVGTILRTADAFDIPLILTDDCAELYNPKTLRASMGAVFRADVQTAGRGEILSELRRQGIPLTVTALTDRAMDVRQADLTGAVAVGSEGSGVSRELLDAADQTAIIPMSPRCESLNAATAASLLLWEMKNRTGKRR